MNRAERRGHAHPDWWFPENRLGALNAVGVCRRCPVMASCARYALDTHRIDGVVAGIRLGGEASVREDRHRLEKVAARGDSDPLDGRTPTTGSLHERDIDAENMPLLVPIPRAAALLGISRAAAYRLAAKGELPIRRLGGRLFVITSALLGPRERSHHDD